MIPRLLLFLRHLGANGEISLSLAQLMVGGGTLRTAHVRTASSPSVTDTLSGSVGPPAPPALGRGRTGGGHSTAASEANGPKSRMAGDRLRPGVAGADRRP